MVLDIKKDTPEYESIYDPKIIIMSKLKEALDKKGESNIHDILYIMGEARKTKDDKIINEVYSEISDSPENYSKIHERLKEKVKNIDYVISIIDGLDHGKSGFNSLNSFNSQRIDVLRNSEYTKYIILEYSKTLPKNPFSINEPNNKFHGLLELKSNFKNDINGLENALKESRNNKKSFRQFLKKYVVYGIKN